MKSDAHARIEHVDTVNINTKSTAESFFGFLGTQRSERRATRQEERREQRAGKTRKNTKQDGSRFAFEAAAVLFSCCSGRASQGRGLVSSARPRRHTRYSRKKGAAMKVGSR